MSIPKFNDDPRLDPRIKALVGAMPIPTPKNVSDREELLEQANTAASKAAAAGLKVFMEMCDTEEIAPSTGLKTTTREFVSEPDGNTIKLQLIQPDS